MKVQSIRSLMLAVFVSTFCVAPLAHAMDEAEVKGLLKKNNCLKCHAPEKAKDGPSYKEIAEKNRGKPDGEARIRKHITTLNKVKTKEGKEEEHEPLKTKDEAEIQAIVQWIASRP